MSIFETKTTENLMGVAELCGFAVLDLKKFYFKNNETPEASKKLSKFIADIKNVVDGITKSIKAYMLLNKQKAPTNQESENIPYPKEMADVLAGMTPDDFNFLKTLQPEIAKMMGGE